MWMQTPPSVWRTNLKILDVKQAIPKTLECTWFLVELTFRSCPFSFSCHCHLAFLYIPRFHLDSWNGWIIPSVMASSIVPAMPPPAGQTSNFVDPPYIGTRFLVVNCVFLPLAVIALAVRTWTRLFIVRSFRFDDCEWMSRIKGWPRWLVLDLMIFALVGLLYCSIIFIWTHYWHSVYQHSFYHAFSLLLLWTVSYAQSLKDREFADTYH